jgi:N-acetylglucosaminyl-diphospho-decaprenol L-rhamnosyltransferase
MGEDFRLGVVVVTWNAEEDIPGLVESLLESQVNGAKLSVVVVDNDSRDETVGTVRALAPEFEVVQLGYDGGYAAGANAGIAHLRDCDAYFVLNPDLRLGHGAIQGLWHEMRLTGAGITVPRLTDEHGSLRFSLRREPTIARAWGEAILGGHRSGRYPRFGEIIVDPAQYHAPRNADWATGAAMFVSRECSRAVGEWDETFFFYSEETDFALRARDLGFVLRYTPAATAHHAEGESKQSSALFSRLTLNRVKLYRSRHGALASGLFTAGIVLGLVLRIARKTHRAGLLALLGRPGIAEEPTPPSKNADQPR